MFISKRTAPKLAFAVSSGFIILCYHLFSKVTTEQKFPETKLVYVYAIPEDILYKGYNMRVETCPFKLYSSEIVVPELIKRHRQFYQPDMKRASLFVVPHFTTCYYHMCLMDNKYTEADCKQRAQNYFADILHWVERNHENWNKNGGRDHIFVFSWDQGSEILGYESLVSNMVSSSIHLVHHGKRSASDQNYSPTKDLVIPVYRDCAELDRLLQKRPVERKIFAYFRGTLIDDYEYSKGIRKIIEQLGVESPDKFYVREGHSDFYWNEIIHSTFALCPPGWSEWSPRFYDAILANSIPVLFGDEWILPFEDLIDYSSLVVQIRRDQLKKIPEMLSKIDKKEVDSKLRQLKDISRMFRYEDASSKGDAIDTILSQLLEKFVHTPAKEYRVYGRGA